MDVQLVMLHQLVAVVFLDSTCSIQHLVSGFVLQDTILKTQEETIIVIHVQQVVQDALILLSVSAVRAITLFSTSNAQLLNKTTMNGQMEVSEGAQHIV